MVISTVAVGDLVAIRVIGIALQDNDNFIVIKQMKKRCEREM
jgi:mannitol/fructose-specific phosphotransferase system IIA component